MCTETHKGGHCLCFSAKAFIKTSSAEMASSGRPLYMHTLKPPSRGCPKSCSSPAAVDSLTNRSSSCLSPPCILHQVPQVISSRQGNCSAGCKSQNLPISTPERTVSSARKKKKADRSHWLQADALHPKYSDSRSNIISSMRNSIALDTAQDRVYMHRLE